MTHSEPAFDLFNRRYRGVVFDLDGTIVDNVSYHKQAWRAFLKRHDVELSEEIFDLELSGHTTQEILFRLLAVPLGSVEAIALEAEKDRFYRELYEAHVQARPGFHDLISLLAQKHVKFAVATSSNQASRNFVLEALELNLNHDLIVGAEAITHPKPAPEIYQVACRRLGLDPADCLAVEDAEAGVESALGAGLDVAVIGAPATRLKGAHVYAEDFRDLLNQAGLA